eukprot:COSAG04_NODE_3998_length_2370_cov_4.308675_3_plen_271_part_00
MTPRSLRITRLRGAGGSLTVDYGAALQVQEALRSRRRHGADSGDSLVLLQHSPVFTLGRRSSAETRRRQRQTGGAAQHEHLLFDRDYLAETGATVADTKRGGQVTFHGRGQLVGYPVLHLRQLVRHDRSLSPRGYIPALEGVLQKTLAAFGVAAAGRSAEGSSLAGVWVGEEKVAAIGVHVSHGITTHGLALNVTPEPLDFFERIVPCGLSAPVTCVAHHCSSPLTGQALLDAVEREFVVQFVERFGYSEIEGPGVEAIDECLARLTHEG